MAAIPTTEEVQAYIGAHNLEQVVEEAVNDAVLNQVKDPFAHIANLLLKHSQKGQGEGVDSEDKKKAAIIADDVGSKEYQKALNEEDVSRAYEKKEVKLPDSLRKELEAFFNKMDKDGDGTVTKAEATEFWGKNFAKVNANAMFNEVDEDGDCTISWSEFIAFWENVVGSGYSTEDLEEEVKDMAEGGSWVDFDDGRTT